MTENDQSAKPDADENVSESPDQSLAAQPVEASPDASKAAEPADDAAGAPDSSN